MSTLYCPKDLSGAPKFIFEGARDDLRPVFLPDFTRQPKSLIHRLLKALVIGRIPVGPRMASWLTGHRGWLTLRQITASDRFLADGVTNPRTLQAIAWILPRGTRLFNYFNNTLSFALPGQDIAALMQKMRDMGYTLLTFDPADAEAYGLQFVEQFYRRPTPDPLPAGSLPHTESLPPTGGAGEGLCFFAGENKGREPQLKALADILQRYDFKSDFIIVNSPEDRITYEEYLQHVARCLCMVDLVQENQAGITRRPVEALFWHKKLITNHLALLQADFYRPENIFILGHDDITRLPLFLQQPLVPVPDSITEKYHVNHFLMNTSSQPLSAPSLQGRAGGESSVLILFFNRPDHLSKVFEQVRIAQPARLFLYQDGPRGERDMPGILACREVVSHVDWPCEVHTLFQERNYGCDPSEYISQKWAFSMTDKCIVLEDDDVPTQSFFRFCWEMLDRYENDERIWMISGFNQEEHTTDVDSSYFFASTFSIWGWASWRRVIDTWDEHYTWLDDPVAVRQLENLIRQRRLRDDFLLTCRRHRELGRAFYETIFRASMLLNNGLAIVPAHNQVNNLGASADSTHFAGSIHTMPRGYRRIFTMGRHELQFPLRHPSNVIDHVAFKERIYRIMCWGHPWLKVARSFEELFLNLRYGNFSVIATAVRNRLRKWLSPKSVIK